MTDIHQYLRQGTHPHHHQHPHHQQQQSPPQQHPSSFGSTGNNPPEAPEFVNSLDPQLLQAVRPLITNSMNGAGGSSTPNGTVSSDLLLPLLNLLQQQVASLNAQVTTLTTRVQQLEQRNWDLLFQSSTNPTPNPPSASTSAPPPLPTPHQPQQQQQPMVVSPPQQGSSSSSHNIQDHGNSPPPHFTATELTSRISNQREEILLRYADTMSGASEIPPTQRLNMHWDEKIGVKWSHQMLLDADGTLPDPLNLKRYIKQAKKDGVTYIQTHFHLENIIPDSTGKIPTPSDLATTYPATWRGAILEMERTYKPLRFCSKHYKANALLTHAVQDTRGNQAKLIVKHERSAPENGVSTSGRASKRPRLSGSGNSGGDAGYMVEERWSRVKTGLVEDQGLVRIRRFHRHHTNLIFRLASRHITNKRSSDPL